MDKSTAITYLIASGIGLLLAAGIMTMILGPIVDYSVMIGLGLGYVMSTWHWYGVSNKVSE